MKNYRTVERVDFLKSKLSLMEILQFFWVFVNLSKVITIVLEYWP
jgi:hypothetical protein